MKMIIILSKLKTISFVVFAIFCLLLCQFPSHAYIMNMDKSNVNLGVGLLGISTGMELNLIENTYAGFSRAWIGSIYRGQDSTSCYLGYSAIKNKDFSVSFLIESLDVQQTTSFSALGAGISIRLPAEDRERTINIIPYIYKDNNAGPNTPFLTPSTGVQVSFPLEGGHKSYVSIRPCLSTYSPAVFYWGFIVDV